MDAVLEGLEPKTTGGPFKKIHHEGKEMGQGLECIRVKLFLWKVLELCCPVRQLQV